MVNHENNPSSPSNPVIDFMRELQDEVSDLWQLTKDGWRAFGAGLRNQMRLARNAQIDYIYLKVGGPLPERAEPPRSFIQRQLPLPLPALSMEDINDMFSPIIDADNVKGVVLIFGGFGTGFATLTNFRQAVGRLRASGKEVVAFTPYLNLPNYYAATAADRIIVPPGAVFDTLGLQSAVTFLRDALAQVGVSADVVQISPYKTAFDNFQHRDMTPEMREQIEWLLDDQYEQLVTLLAAGRQMTLETMRGLIDQAPIFAADAVQAGLIDGVAYEDELPTLLAKPEAETEMETDTAVTDSSPAKTLTESSAAPSEKADLPRVELMPFSKAYPLLMEKTRRQSRKFIGVVSLEGLIVMGQSTEPPVDLPLPLVGGATAGADTIIRTLRHAEKMNDLAALIFHVDSGGGDALASDLIGREIERLNRKIPVVVYMGNVAASGGYYVSAGSRHIMSQANTVTGSIGVITMLISTRGLYDRLSLNRVQIKRGKRAGLYSGIDVLTEEERDIFWKGIVQSYQEFKKVVANGRNLPLDQLDPICEGRVWTGRQALDHKLVDSHGDFLDAVKKAAEFAGLPLDDDHEVPVVNLYPRDGGHIAPKPFAAIEEISQVLFGRRLEQFNGRSLMLMPFDIRFH